jgi:hypothetical protein
MKRKRLFLGIAVLLAAGGVWLARSGKVTEHLASPESTMGMANKTPDGAPASESSSGLQPASRPQLAPPDPARRFTDFTPEQRVGFARQGHGPGG